MTELSAAALADLNVLDLSGHVAGPYCTKMLADFGASVVKVEPPGGEPGRSLPPLIDGQNGSDASAFFLYLNGNKRGITLDVTTAAGIDALRRLLPKADVLVESFAPGTLDELGLDYAELETISPGIIVTSVTPFGQTGPWRDRQIDELVAYACSGWASINGWPDREPLKGNGYQASMQAGIMAFIATMNAVVYRDRTGLGQHIDISILEPLVATFAPTLLAAQYQGAVPGRHGPGFTRGPVPTRDGYFALTLSRAHFWRDAMNALGLPELANDQRFYTTTSRREHAAEVAAQIEGRIATWGKRDLFETMGTLRVVGGMVLTTEELVDDPHVRARDALVEADHPVAGRLTYPGAPFKMSQTPWSLNRAAPRLGEHTVDVLRGTGNSDASLVDRKANENAQEGLGVCAGPLAGLRSVVFTQAWAGTFATELLGLMGAEVIQIELRQRPDNWRGGLAGAVPAALRGLDSAVHPWNCSPNYNSVNLNKLAITLDLSSPEGRQVIRQLVTVADIVVDNFSPRVMGNLGLDYASLTKIRPDVIAMSMSAFGATGPYGNFPGIGGTIEPMAGMSALMGYEGGPPINSGNMYPDAVAGSHGAAALLIALHYRERTGRGQYIDLSMQETNMQFIADALMDFSANRRVRSRAGNHHPTIAPHNVYTCAGPGGPSGVAEGRASQTSPGGPSSVAEGRASQTSNDRWIAISAHDDAEFSRLCAVAGHPDWQDDARFRDRESRKRNERQLDDEISCWTANHDAFELEDALQQAGVTAAAVRNAHDVLATAWLQERETIVEVRHPEAGSSLQTAVPWRMSRTPGGVTRPAPMLGQHSHEVLCQLLGFDEGEYDRLDAAGITGAGTPN